VTKVWRGRGKPVLAAAIVLLAGPLAARAFSYNEVSDGDIPSFDENAPTPLGSLDSGANVISGTATAVSDWGDVFSIDVPPGLAIKSIVVQVSGHTGGFGAATKVFETPVYASLDSQIFAADGSHSFAVVPLLPASYGFTAAFSSAGAGASYDWQWTVTAPEPSGTALQLAAGAAFFAATRAKRRSR